MLTLASVNVMLVLDRIMLAKLGKEYLNATVTAGSICNIFIFGAVAIAGVADVFIGRYIGSREFQKIGKVLWQMLWFSCLLAVFFLIVGQVGAPYLVSGELTAEAECYFRWQMSFGFLPVIAAILTSFLIGTRHFAYVLFAVLSINITKFILQFPLTLGINGFFSGFGIKGAVLATMSAHLLHIILLSVIIFNTKNRRNYNTASYKLDFKLFKNCMKLGIPQSLGTTINYATWAIVVSMLGHAGEKHLMMYTIVDSFYMLLGFCTEAMQKGVMYIAANLIGCNQYYKIHRLFTNSVWLLLLILAILSLPLLLFPHLITNRLQIGILSHKEIYLACVVSWLYLSFEGITWILSGILTAMEDSMFVGPVYALASVFFGVGGTFCLTRVLSCDATMTCWVTVFYGLGYACLLGLRYRKFGLRETDYSELISSNA